MGGREDYESRKELRKQKYEELSRKAKAKSEEYYNSNANRILAMTPRTTNNNWTSFRKNSKKIT